MIMIMNFNGLNPISFINIAIKAVKSANKYPIKVIETNWPLKEIKKDQWTQWKQKIFLKI